MNPADPDVKNSVLGCIIALLHWVNDCPQESFNHDSVRRKVQDTALAISEVDRRAELGELRLMLIMQICALSCVVLHPSRKLLYLLYPIPGKGSANHLLNVGVASVHHQDALKRILHRFDLGKFGNNAGESLLCESLPGRNVFDAFLQGQDLFLMNEKGRPLMKRYGKSSWEDVIGSDLPEI